jgi:DNA ligase (NAD+)
LSQATLKISLVLVDEIGEIAKSVLEFLKMKKNRIIIDRLKNFRLQFEIIENINP